ncbi:MAG: hypothetical protein LC808_21280, partial [Actinobacteria bacterium]|nr:hypothetical protein [Actinomycetota bacterium]
MSTLAWGLAGALSAFTAILTQPTVAFSTGGTFGPTLLLRALAGAVIARMSSLGVALVAGIGFGIIEQLILWNYSDPALITVVLFGIILVGLLVQRQVGGREEEKGSWAAVQALRPVPEAFRRLWLVRNLGRIVAAVALAGAILLPIVLTNSDSVTMTGIFGFAIVGLSVGFVTGLAGQLTLGQFALAAIGGIASVYVSQHTGNFPLSFIYAGVAAGAVSLFIGLPALRIKGLLLTVTTLSFALMVPTWLLPQSWAFGLTPKVPRVSLFGYEFSTGRSYYYFGLGLLLITTWLMHNARRGGFGRLLVGIRDNEDAARSFTVPATIAKTQAFLLSGFIAGIGGALYVHSLSLAAPTAFPVEASIQIVVM